MNKLASFIKAMEGLAIILWCGLVAYGLPVLIINVFKLWGSAFAHGLVLLWPLAIVFIILLACLSFSAWLLTRIYNYKASGRGQRLTPGLQAFEDRCLVISLIVAGLLVAACFLTHWRSDRTPEFVKLYQRLNSSGKLAELTKRIADDDKPELVQKLHEEIMALAGRDFEIHFFRKRDGLCYVLLFWDAATKAHAADLYQPRMIREIEYMPLPTEAQPVVLEKLKDGDKWNVPLIGLMRFNTPDGALLALVETPPNIITLMPE